MPITHETDTHRGQPQLPQLPTGRIDVVPPPDLGDADHAGSGLGPLVPMLAGSGSMLLIGGLGQPGGLGSRGIIAAGALVATTVAFVALQLDRQRMARTRRVRRLRTGYQGHLREIRAMIRTAATQQRLALSWRYPEPSELPGLVSRGLPGRRPPGDPAFLQVRYGVSTQRLAVEVSVPPTHHPDTVDPVSAAALERLLGVHSHQDGLPAALDLARFANLHIEGPLERARSLARAIVCSAVATHGAEHLRVAALVTPQSLGHWEWLKWLPHHASPVACDAAGPLRMLGLDTSELGTLLPDGTGTHLLLVEDGAPAMAHHEQPGRTALRVGAGRAPGNGLTLELTGPDQLSVHTPGTDDRHCFADRCEPATAQALARRLAGRASPSTWHDPLPGEPLPDEHLVATLGTGEVGSVRLDLKEAAAGGAGPHGLLVGATGSGKSELLRTLVLGLALKHTPEELNLALVDFKGGATFAGLEPLPHVSALITNLADHTTLIDRMQDALGGELVRRQELLRRGGGFSSAQEYGSARRMGADLPPLPTLLVVVDEFSELLGARPDFIDVFVGIGRLGRSLGLHLLLASQRIEEGRLRGLESHLSYRIALRTFSAADSQAVLGRPDAFELPQAPGWGLLQSPGGALQRFRAARVSWPARRQPSALARPVPFTARPTTHTQAEKRIATHTTLEAEVSALRRQHRPARPLWLPPLGDPEPLDALLEEASGHSGLTATIGVLDHPREQRRAVLRIDLATAHLAIVGGPRSGKSTALATILASLGLVTPPDEAQVYVLDLGGGILTRLAGLPQVAAVATRTTPDVVRRVVAELGKQLDRSEQGDGSGQIVLVVDGWGALRAEFEDVEPRLQDWATRGSSYGMHLVAATTRWSDFRPSTRDLFGHRLELRLGDPLDSEIDRARAARVPERTPGRGISAGGLEFRAALPRVDAESDPTTLDAGISDLVARSRAAWQGRAAPRLRLLPTTIDLEEVRRQAPPRSGRLILGLAEPDLAPMGLDLDLDPHLLVLGDLGSGRTNLLRVLCREISRTSGPDQAQVLLLDPRRGLLGELPTEQMLAQQTTVTAAAEAVAELATALTSRLPGPCVTPEQMRTRSWWTGADVFVLVDDYELIAQPVSPLAPLVPLLPHARDVGLHVIVARRCGGAGRALYEPLLHGLRDLQTPGLLLSGSREEGPLLGGVRPEPALPGRGRLVTRDQTVRTVQVAHVTPAR